MKNCIKGVAVLLLTVLLSISATFVADSGTLSEEPTTTGSTLTEVFSFTEQVVTEFSTVEETTEESTTMSEMIVEKPSTTKATKKALTTIPQTKERPLSETKSLGQFKLTAYCSCRKCCGKYAENRPTDSRGETIVYGASGNKLSADRSIAVDTSIIPYGSKVIINGRTYVAEDCGGKVKGKHIDVYFSNHSKALEFGKKYAEVYLVVE